MSRGVRVEGGPAAKDHGPRWRDGYHDPAAEPGGGRLPGRGVSGALSPSQGQQRPPESHTAGRHLQNTQGTKRVAPGTVHSTLVFLMILTSAVRGLLRITCWREQTS